MNQVFRPTLMNQTQAAQHEWDRLVAQLREEEGIAHLCPADIEGWTFTRLRKRIEHLRRHNQAKLSEVDFQQHPAITLGEWLASK